VSTEFQPSDPERFNKAMERFDKENSRDPNREPADGGRPRELIYAEWLTHWVLRLCPSASEPLRLAARAQHLCRWEIPRDSYPATRAGYLKWREALKSLHAQKAGEILQQVGYDEATIRRVQELISKRLLPHDAETQVLEDALCLIFLEHQLTPLAKKTPEDKVINALRKSWAKMSPVGRKEALELRLGEREAELVERALRQA
jgi:Domain of unknown function (DUF4202)